ncbi:MAG TPA: rhomboid family intramembrane serine protease [Rhodanobacteraceae bacterium]|nr:rhomboid family intramembrane serine protease [Rhodanobacteraceae bacterium]
MLILPLHRRLTRSNFPLVTALLIVANVFVLVFLQSSDGRVLKQAQDYYAQSGLGKIEFPAYQQWLLDHPTDPRRLQLLAAAPAPIKLALIESDRDFQDALDSGRIITPTNSAYADWHGKRLEFERLRDSTFTARHAARFKAVEPGRVMWSMFMHAGYAHLIGNMLFLLMLGMLVEGALGPAWFLGLYLAGGIGAAAVSLAWHWGESGYGLGASGAIAALMGAYCVLWGLRKVRVFYWFFVVFDYVRVPALVLLPFWLGWELFSLWSSPNAHVAFEAHAGGIVSGALLGFALKKTGHVRQGFIEEDERVAQADARNADFDRALHHLGRLEIAPARRLLQDIDAAEPGRLDVLSALYRCARYGGKPAELDAAALRVFAFPAKTQSEWQALKELLDDYLKACRGVPKLPARSLLGLAEPLLRQGGDSTVETLLQGLAQAEPAAPRLAAAWFAFALHADESTALRKARLQQLVARFPNSPYADKARFLLQQG